MFICKIHNNQLGKSVIVFDWESAIETLIEWIKSDGYSLTPNDLENLHNVGEYYNDDDSDNVVTYSVGILEQ